MKQRRSRSGFVKACGVIGSVWLCFCLSAATLPVFGSGTGIMAGVNPFIDDGIVLRSLIRLTEIDGKLAGRKDSNPVVEIELVAPGCQASDVIVCQWKDSRGLRGLQLHAIPCVERNLKWVNIREHEPSEGIWLSVAIGKPSLGPFYWKDIHEPTSRGNRNALAARTVTVGLPLVVLGGMLCLSRWAHRKQSSAWKL